MTFTIGATPSVSGGHHPTWESGVTSRPTARPRRRQREGIRGPSRSTFGRPALPTSCERRPRREQRQPGSGCEAMYGDGIGIDLPLEEGYGRAWRRRERSWLDNSTSFNQDTQPWQNTFDESDSPRRTGAGGAAAGKGRQASTCWLSAGGGEQKSEGYGRE